MFTTCRNKSENLDENLVSPLVLLQPVINQRKIVDFRVRYWNKEFITVLGIEQLQTGALLKGMQIEGITELTDQICEYLNNGHATKVKAQLQGQQYEVSVTKDNSFYLVMLVKAAENRPLSDRYDLLTGTFNRTYFKEQLTRLDKVNNLPLGVMMLDANGLKLINDTFGYEMGDKYLQRIARLLKSVLSKEQLLARIGSDEFAVILPTSNLGQLKSLARRIKRKCEYHYTEPFRISLAIGTAVKTNPSQYLQKIVKQAEDRMNQNKLLEERSSRNYLVLTLRQSLEEKTHETQAHSMRIAELALRMGVMFDLSDHQMDELRLLAFFHDIGKIAVSDSILKKPESLTAIEWVEMKKHCEIGYRIAISSPDLVPIANSILSHHERWDGRGYPMGLKGEKIPLLARIISVLDAYDTMTHERTYKKKITQEAAVAEIVCCSGTQFDPQVVEAFQKVMNPKIIFDQLEVERKRLNKTVADKGINSIEAIGQSRKIDSIINQINSLELEAVKNLVQERQVVISNNG